MDAGTRATYGEAACTARATYGEAACTARATYGEAACTETLWTNILYGIQALLVALRTWLIQFSCKRIIFNGHTDRCTGQGLLVS
jgi:hypothetical protein